MPIRGSWSFCRGAWSGPRAMPWPSVSPRILGSMDAACGRWRRRAWRPSSAFRRPGGAELRGALHTLPGDRLAAGVRALGPRLRHRGGAARARPRLSGRSGAPRSCRSPPATTAARARSWSDSPCDTIPPTTSSTPPCPRTIRSGRTCCTASTGVPSWRRRRASAATLNLVERLGRGASLTPDDVGDTDRLHRRTRRPMRGFVERRSPTGRRDRR